MLRVRILKAETTSWPAAEGGFTQASCLTEAKINLGHLDLRFLEQSWVINFPQGFLSRRSKSI